MKKQLFYVSAIALFASTQISLYGSQTPQIKALHTQNKKTSQSNKAAYANKDYFTLFVMQPTPGYSSLNGCVNYLFRNNRFPKKYTKIPQKDWHISLIAIAVPFIGKPGNAEVDRAAQRLQIILRRYKHLMRGSSFSYSKISSIGTNKFIATHYNFASGETKFLEAYAKAIKDFFAYYRQAYMLYGYKVVPHISVASTNNPGKAININTSGCYRINNINLMHSGRNIYVAGSYYDPKNKTIVRRNKLTV